MKKVYHVATCDTCQRIIQEADLNKKGYACQNIKEDKITAEQLDEMKAMIGSYEALFSRRALKYKSMGLKDKRLSEKDYRDLILQEYTFLKRPVVISGKKIFSGSEKKTVREVVKLK
jgi:arsenate reductase (glutaredoxin)